MLLNSNLKTPLTKTRAFHLDLKDRNSIMQYKLQFINANMRSGGDEGLEQEGNTNGTQCMPP